MKVDSTKQAEITARTIAWLHEVWSLVEEGRPVQPDPFYSRNAVLGTEVVKAVIDDMEALFVKELEKYPGYHRNAQGISESEYLVPPGFDKMAAGEQLAVVQGIDKIFADYRVEG
jgi:hypothetical protein